MLEDRLLGEKQRGERAPGRQRAIVTAIAGVVLFLATVTQSPARFLYDATGYWNGSVALANGGDPYIAGVMTLRGVLTSLLYLPAALAVKGSDPSAGGLAVLVENSLLVAFVGVLLLPGLLRAWGPVTSRMVWVCAGLTWIAVGRFAPYPLMDLWGAVVSLAAVVALQRRTTIGLIGAGLLAGIAFNVRPAYLLPLLMMVGVVFLTRRLSGMWFVGGAVVALLPQSIMNLAHGVSWIPWPRDMTALTQQQADHASYIVRYDTAVYGPVRNPQQFFCDPSMAQAVGNHPPGSTRELVSLYLHNPSQSFVFLLEKASAAVHWPLSAPYLSPGGAGDHLFALLVTAITVVGAAALAHGQLQSGVRSTPLPVWATLAVWLGSLTTLVTPSPESRFALPLVLLGIAGCSALLRQRPGKRWIAGTILMVVGVFALGNLGLSHPAPAGGISPAICTKA